MCYKQFFWPLGFAKSLLIYSKTGAIIFHFEIFFLIIHINYLDSFLNHPSYLCQFYFILSYTINDYSMTCYLGSKEGISIATDSSPNGSYTTTLGWLKAHRQDKINIPDPSAVISCFDNNQVLIIYYYHFIIIFYL